jgi:hypothetical protein
MMATTILTQRKAMLARADELRKAAQKARDAKAKTELMKLASMWQRLAQMRSSVQN